MNIEEANKILAKACGVEVYKSSDNQTWHNNGIPFFWWTKDNLKHDYEWTISDARCREVVRERFYIVTDALTHEADGSMVFDRWVCYMANGVVHSRGKGKTIAEAEISCMIKIAEGLDV